MCWGFVVCDSEGSASMARVGCIEVVSDALCTEAHACIAALNVTTDGEMQNIVLETDSQILVSALQMKEHDQTMGGVLFREAKFITATMFAFVSVLHVTCIPFL